MARPKRSAPLPTREQILEFIRDSAGPVGRREIVRAFGVSGSENRAALNALLKTLAAEGAFERKEKADTAAAPRALPPVAVLEITGTDLDGELLARPVAWEAAAEPPHIFVADRGTHLEPALEPGDRLLARLSRVGDGYEARTIRRLARQPRRVVGVLRVGPDGMGRIEPTNRRVQDEFLVGPRDLGEAGNGDVVIAEVLASRRLGMAHARVAERLGRVGEPRTFSIVAVHENGIPTAFSDHALAQAEAAGPAPLGRRSDLRDLPLVTIDGEDARDFDDAVFAEADDDPENEGGWRLLVAIADVAWYVRPDDPLDRNAAERGNSVYFPDRVVPMLPEPLSNGWCSLKPEEERPCMAAWLWIDKHGALLRHRFVRGLMRSAARLTYEQAQAAADGAPDGITRPLMERVIRPLYGAYAALAEARRRRGTLDLDLPERRVLIGDDGHIEAIVPRARLDSHRLIEEFMIAANVAAAEALEAKRAPAMYRVHDAPDPAKLEALRQFLATLDIPLARGQVARPAMFTAVLEKAARTPYATMVNELVLRSQSQAVYSPRNLGHFGLALRRYCHFTSPIRRYADLLVHRSLIAACRLGDGGLTPAQAERFVPLGEAISATERRAMAAERDALDRYTAAFLADKVGAIFPGRVGGVTRFGLFVRLDDSGADGLVPISSLPADFYRHEELRHALVGQRWGRVYTLGDRVMVRLVEAQIVTGSLVFHIVEGEDAAPGAGRRDSARAERDAKRRKAAAARKAATARRGARGPGGSPARSPGRSGKGPRRRR